ncbi:MAG: NAD(P)H-binding protein [Bacteroidota bacterium]
MTIAVATPTGNIGQVLVRQLLTRNANLVLLARKPDALPADVRGQVRVEQGELQDAAYLQEATAGADALFWLTPANYATPSMADWYDALIASATNAVTKNGIGRVVNLSSQGAHRLEGLGPVSGLGRVENAFDETDADVVHLRPGFFMENLLGQLDAVRHTGAMYYPSRTDVPVAMVATQDIAVVAADWLMDTTWSGRHVAGIHGPRDLSYDEAAQLVGETLGVPARAQQVPVEATVEQLQQFASPDWAKHLGDLYSNIATEDYSAEPRTEATTTPTTLEAFLAERVR